MTLRRLALFSMAVIAALWLSPRLSAAASLEAAADEPHAASEHAVAADEGQAPHEARAHDAEHGAEGEGAEVELPNFIMLLFGFHVVDEHSALGHWIHVFENAIFSMIAGIFLSIVAIVVYRRRQDLPGRLQAFVEMVVETIENMVVVVLGKEGRHYTPFVGTIFLYLLCMNYSGMVPLGKAATSTFLNNIAIALCVFLYVQYTGLRKNGLLGYLHHLCGSPKDLTGWLLSPLMLFLEVFGELVKPLSLSLRLFGNIFGEDLLLAIFALLGIILVSLLGLPRVVGLPLHLPFMFLSLLLGFIQAMVFAMLTTAYIGLMLPHEEHH